MIYMMTKYYFTKESHTKICFIFENGTEQYFRSNYSNTWSMFENEGFLVSGYQDQMCETKISKNLMIFHVQI